MDSEDTSVGESAYPAEEAPSPRARALREEILGSALTLDEVAFVLSLDRTTVAKYLREHALSGFQIGREWRIPEEELRAYVKRMIEGQRRADIAAGTAWSASAPHQRGFFERVREDLFQERRKQPKGERGEKSGRFDKFTKRAQRVLVLAQEEAVVLRHNYIGTEHLLLGLIAEGEGVAARVLTNLGVDLAQARAQVETVIGRGEKVTSGEVGLTPRAKKVIELALDEARRMDHHYVGTEHLLLGLVREGHGVAAGVLESSGLSLGRVREQTLQLLERVAPSDAASSSPSLPPEAAALVSAADPGIACARCDARSPQYFHYCFNCGARLAEDDRN